MAEIIIFLSVYAFVVLVDRESSDDKKDVFQDSIIRYICWSSGN